MPFGLYKNYYSAVVTSKGGDGLSAVLSIQRGMVVSCGGKPLATEFGDPCRWPITLDSHESAADFHRFAASGVNMLLATPPGALTQLLKTFNTVQSENVVPKQLRECEKTCECSIYALEGEVPVNEGDRGDI